MFGKGLYFLLDPDLDLTSTGTNIIEDSKKITKSQVLNLSMATKGQSNSAMWSAHRHGRVTASLVHRVLRMRDPASVVRAVMKYEAKDISHVPAIKWGLEHEAQVYQKGVVGGP